MSAALIWGRRPVLEALKGGTVRRIFISAGRDPSPVLREIRDEARQRGVPVAEVNPAEIARLAPLQPAQGVVAEVAQPRRPDLEELLRAETDRARFFLVLDQVQDPHNLGALLRTANAAGVEALIVPERRAAHAGGVVAKVSAGAVAHTPMVVVSNLARALDRLREANVWIVGLDGSAAQSVYEADLTIPLALVTGGEGEGLRRLTRERCDFLVHIPMLGQVGSLNASVAGAIAMYEAVRQRLLSG